MTHDFVWYDIVFAPLSWWLNPTKDEIYSVVAILELYSLRSASSAYCRVCVCICWSLFRVCSFSNGVKHIAQISTTTTPPFNKASTKLWIVLFVNACVLLYFLLYSWVWSVAITTQFEMLSSANLLFHLFHSLPEQSRGYEVIQTKIHDFIITQVLLCELIAECYPNEWFIIAPEWVNKSHDSIRWNFVSSSSLSHHIWIKEIVPFSKKTDLKMELGR